MTEWTTRTFNNSILRMRLGTGPLAMDFMIIFRPPFYCIYCNIALLFSVWRKFLFF